MSNLSLPKNKLFTSLCSFKSKGVIERDRVVVILDYDLIPNSRKEFGFLDTRHYITNYIPHPGLRSIQSFIFLVGVKVNEDSLIVHGGRK